MRLVQSSEGREKKWAGSRSPSYRKVTKCSLRSGKKSVKFYSCFELTKIFKIFISIATTVLLIFMLNRHVTSLAQKCKRQEKERKQKVKVEGTVLILILPSAHA